MKQFKQDFIRILQKFHNFLKMVKKLVSHTSLIILIVCSGAVGEQAKAQTEITKWQYGKKTAVSITYDDGNRNQFKVALPIMERMNLPATFFIITGPIKGSVYLPKFVGRPVKEIISETATVPTNAGNFFERASASMYLGYENIKPFYDKADELYGSGKNEQAYKVMDSLYKAVRNNKLTQGESATNELNQEKGLTWSDVKKYAAKGYEFASHTVSHAHLAILDTANMGYQLRKSKEEISNQLGPEYTFSAEVPYGIEDLRVMKYAIPIYEALRNLMPDPFMKEINRGYQDQPRDYSEKPYVQWQRGPLSKTPLPLMKSWVDTSLSHDNIWLVLVFHGIDSLGWESTPHEKLEEYFSFIKNKEKNIWVATFGDVARYIRERMNSKVTENKQKNKIIISLTHSLDKNMYDEPLTLKTYVPESWKNISIKKQNAIQKIKSQKDAGGIYVLYQAIPNKGMIEISKD